MKAFIDTNIIVYSYASSDPDRRVKSTDLVAKYEPVISTQVLAEYVNVMRRKFNTPWLEIREALSQFQQVYFVHLNSNSTIERATHLAEKYQFSYFDSLIVAAAIETQCPVLFTEDLQHNQLVEGIRIINPFV